MTAPAQPIRLALVTSGGLDPGGAERQMLLLAENLPREEFSIDFICLRFAGEDAARARAAGAGVKVVGVTRPHDFGPALPLYPFHLAWTMARYVALTARRYDVIDAWLYHAYALAALCRPLTRPRALMAGRRSLGEFKSRFGLLDRAADAVARRAVDTIVANSDAVRADVIRREGILPERIRVIRNAVEPGLDLRLEERRDRRATWAASDTTIVVGCVANYRPGKGHDLLIRTAARIAHRRPDLDIRFVLVGDGTERPRLERLRASLGVEQSVVLHGLEPDARVLYPAFDLAVQASEAEGLPNVVLEAAAAGLPVVATAAGGTAEIIRDGETGLLIPLGDEAALTDALLRLADDPYLRRHLGAEARRDVLARFAKERMVGDFAALYRTLARPRGRA